MSATRELVKSLLEQAQDLDARTAWDRVWRELLALILDGGTVPEGTLHDIIPEVQRYLAAREAQQELLLEKCASYLCTNRGPGLAYSELWCIAKFQDGRQVRFHKTSKANPQHAEIQAIKHLADLRDGKKLQSVEMYMNVSPCSGCAGAILGFLQANSGVQASIYFSSVFAHHGDNHRRGLRALRLAGVTLAVFDGSCWRALARCVQNEENEEKADNERAISSDGAQDTTVRGLKRKLNEDLQFPTQKKRQK